MSSNSNHHPCGSFDLTDGDVTDTGQCNPRRIKKTCAAPELPVQECPNEETTMVYNAAEEDFDLIGQLMDENCEQVLDENSDPILTPIK